MQTLLVVIFGCLTLFFISITRTYRHISIKELKRRARAGDEWAKMLYQAGSYGHSLTAILWLIIGLCSAAFFVLLSENAPFWVALLGSAALIWYGFVWAPSRNISAVGKWTTARISPVLARTLSYLHPLLSRTVVRLHSLQPVTIHTGLYEKEDLLELLDRQSGQVDSRINETELSIARQALTFGDKSVEDILVPRKVVKSVSAEELVGPVLMSELHESGFSRFPVYEDKKDNIIGTLYLRDLINAKSGGLVRKRMRQEVCFIHEEQTLVDALKAILRTRQHLFIVVNSFEEYVGVITIEDVLEQIVGQPIVDEFDQYDDMRAVAAIHAEKEHKAHLKIDDEIQLD